jgi:hypothetical protein
MAISSDLLRLAQVLDGCRYELLMIANSGLVFVKSQTIGSWRCKRYRVRCV